MRNRFLRKYLITYILLFISILFSFWLMFHTFSYNDGHILIGTKLWSDFAGHIPLIRSFSYGLNLSPIEYPLFPGEPNRYHFLFYAIVGFLERSGLRIDWALNIPSALGFFALMMIIYYLAKNIFKSSAVGILSVIFFLFNGSFSFIEFFKTHPFSQNTITDIITNVIFPSFGPYDGKIVSAFWNLNIYTNQRHLALSIAILMFLFLYVFKVATNKRNFSYISAILWITLVGILPYLHFGIFIMLYITIGILFLLLPKARLLIFFILFFGGVLALPRILLLQSGVTSSGLEMYTGYLATDHSFRSIMQYWFMNLGLSLIFIPIGFIVAPRDGKKLFLAVFPLFLIGNLLRFGPDISTNHKFFTLFIIIGNMFSAYALYKIWHLHQLGKIVVPIVFFFMILSGIIDFFPIKNDSLISLADYPKNPDIQWILENTPKDAVFLNSSYLYHPVSLAGRKIFLGWPYFPWSLGYDTLKRDTLRKNLYIQSALDSFCKIIRHYDISYVETQGKTGDVNFVNHGFFESNFLKVYQNKESEFAIYSIKPTCKNHEQNINKS